MFREKENVELPKSTSAVVTFHFTALVTAKRFDVAVLKKIIGRSSFICPAPGGLRRCRGKGSLCTRGIRGKVITFYSTEWREIRSGELRRFCSHGFLGNSTSWSCRTEQSKSKLDAGVKSTLLWRCVCVGIWCQLCRKCLWQSFPVLPWSNSKESSNSYDELMSFNTTRSTVS